MQGKARPTPCSLSSLLLHQVLHRVLKEAAGRQGRMQLLHGLQKPTYKASSSCGWPGPDWASSGGAPRCQARPPCAEEVRWDSTDIPCLPQSMLRRSQAAMRQGPRHFHSINISSPYHRYLVLISVFSYSCIMSYIMMYHDSWYDMIYRDIEVCVVGAWAVVGGHDITWYHVISCDIM